MKRRAKAKDALGGAGPTSADRTVRKAGTAQKHERPGRCQCEAVELVWAACPESATEADACIGRSLEREVSESSSWQQIVKIGPQA